MNKFLGLLAVLVVAVAVFFLFFQQPVPPAEETLSFKEGVLEAEKIIEGKGASFSDFLSNGDNIGSIDGLRESNAGLIELKDSLSSYGQSNDLDALSELLDIYVLLGEAYVMDFELFLDESDFLLVFADADEPSQELLEEMCKRIEEMEEFNEKDFQMRLKYLEVNVASEEFLEKFSGIEEAKAVVPEVEADFQPNHEDLAALFYFTEKCIDEDLLVE